jgi:hypothetical protein
MDDAGNLGMSSFWDANLHKDRVWQQVTQRRLRGGA